MFFAYGEKEAEYLRRRDKRFGDVIDKIGHIDRETDTDLFSSIVHHIIGQQISTKAQATIWRRMREAFGAVTVDHIAECSVKELQSFGTTYRKAEYISAFSKKVQDGSFDLEGIRQKTDQEAIAELTSLKGIGVWTAEMILLFCMERPDVFSFDDLAIQRGLRMVYHHRKIDRKLFEKYRRRFSPYCSVASLYLWAVAGGAVADMKDYAPKRLRTQKEKEPPMNDQEKIRAILRRDASADGQFYYGCKTTKIVCKPSCRARVPLERNIVLFDTVEHAVKSGYRPCKMCMRTGL